MKKEELKKVLKPLVKQCINEVLLEEGLLSTVIAEVVKGTSGSHIIETKKVKKGLSENQLKLREKLKERQKKLFEAVGADAYNGVNVFEDITPTSNPPAPGESQVQGPLSGVSPNDPGADISSLMSMSNNWTKMVDK